MPKTFVLNVHGKIFGSIFKLHICIPPCLIPSSYFNYLLVRFSLRVDLKYVPIDLHICFSLEESAIPLRNFILFKAPGFLIVKNMLLLGM